MSNKRRILCLMVWGIFVLCKLGVAQADIVTYTLDPTRSEVTASGDFNGSTLTTNIIGSTNSPTTYSGFVAPFGGTIVIDQDESANTFQITDGSIRAGLADLYQAIISSDPANYSFYAFPGDNEIIGTLQFFSFSLQSNPSNTPAAFDASQVFGTITSGEVDWNEIVRNSGLNGSYSETGSSPVTGPLSFGPAAGSLEDIGGIQTLTLPINTQFVVMINGSPLDIDLSGTLVAVGNVPEPGTCGLFAFAALILTFKRLK